ncbi:MAG: PAS domain-containing protein [Parasphingorhabdus sp.]|uniref:PAS domain-containing protein n=1 Tax=Parasphingorhabdus sp. TaxID=2709688 RepID=UPI003299896F
MDDKEATTKGAAQTHPWYGGLEFRTLAESIPALVFVGDTNGANIYSNAQFSRYTGLAAEEILGDRWLKVIHPDDQQRAASTWLESWTKGVPYDTKYRFRRFDGEYRWHVVRGTPVRDANGNIIRWIGSCTDVEDIIAQMTVQTQSEKILEALGKASDLIVYAKDADGQFIYANEAVLDTVSQKRQSILGKSAENLAVEDQEGAAISENDALVRETGKAHTVLESWTLAGAETRHFRSTKVPLSLPDGSVGIAALSFDITESVLAKRNYQEATAHSQMRIDTLPMITWVCDELGHIVEVNQAWHDHAGFNAGHDVNFRDIIMPESIDNFSDHWIFCVENDQILDIEVNVRDHITQTALQRRALAIPMQRQHNGKNQKLWYGSFS